MALEVKNKGTGGKNMIYFPQLKYAETVTKNIVSSGKNMI
jgi:hypothetical protein